MKLVVWSLVFVVAATVLYMSWETAWAFFDRRAHKRWTEHRWRCYKCWHLTRPGLMIDVSALNITCPEGYNLFMRCGGVV